MNAYFSELKGRSVLVTGGSKGIGKEMALAFAELGANVAISGRNAEALELAVSELRVHNPACCALQADVRDVQQVRRMVEETAEAFGTIDVLVNNAGTNITKPAFEVTEEDWDAVLETNLKSAFFASQAAARHMKEQGGGSIINIASQMAFVGYVKRAAYSSSKGGMVQLTKALAVEWAGIPIRVNAVAPTFIETEMTAKMFEDEAFKQDVESRILLGKLAKPKDMNGAVLYLASDLSAFVTGETIKVDGGWTAI